MADAWQSAFVEVVPDFSNFRRDANRQMTSILGDAGDSAGVDGSQRFGSSFVGGLGRVAGPIAAAFAAIGIGQIIADGVRFGLDYIQQSVVAASDLSESGNALRVSFAEAADEIGRLGETAANRLGLSNVAFNQIATQFSAFGKTIAGEGGNVVGVIDELSTRGADFASVFNIEVADALALFQSGLAGETEPLRRYGIDLSAAAVASYAYANGIAAQGKQLTEQQRVQAAYGALMQQTAQTQGDFANTSDQLANQQRILAAEFDNAQSRLGTALLPALTTLMQLANEQLVPVLNQVVDQVGPTLAAALSESAPAFGQLITAAAPLIPQLVQLVSEAIPPLIGFLIAVSPLLIDWATNSTAALQVVSGLFGYLDGSNSLADLGRDLLKTGGSFISVAQTIAQFQVDTTRAIAAVLTSVRTFAGSTVSLGRDFIQGFINGFTSQIGSLTSKVRSTFEGIVSSVKDVLDINSPSRVFADIGKQAGLGYERGMFKQLARMDVSADLFVPSVAGVGGARVSLDSVQGQAAQGTSAGGFNNYGTIQVTDERKLVDEVEKRKRRANAESRLGRLTLT